MDSLNILRALPTFIKIFLQAIIPPEYQSFQNIFERLEDTPEITDHHSFIFDTISGIEITAVQLWEFCPSLNANENISEFAQ
jgi:hypothetical protein